MQKGLRSSRTIGYCNIREDRRWEISSTHRRLCSQLVLLAWLLAMLYLALIDRTGRLSR